jgi:PhnB protein
MPSQELIEAMGKYNQELIAAGIMQDGGGLRPSSQGARVTFSGKDRLVRMGPFSNTAELVSGYWIWNCTSLEEAIRWVKHAPNPIPESSDIEIRQLYELEDLSPAKK